MGLLFPRAPARDSCPSGKRIRQQRHAGAKPPACSYASINIMDVRNRGMAVIDTDADLFFDASPFGDGDVRIYQADPNGGNSQDAWVLRLTGANAEAKAEAIAAILRERGERDGD